MVLLLLGAPLLGAPRSVSGQAAERQAHASLEVSLAATSVRESATTLAGAVGLLDLGGRLAFGAGGAIMIGSSALEGGGLDQDLHLGYGGAVLQFTLTGSPQRYLALRTLVGSGNAKIKLAVGGGEVAADNFGVLEPGLVGTVTLAGPLRLGAGVAYRHVFGVDDLPNVVPADLKGPVAQVRISIRTY